MKTLTTYSFAREYTAHQLVADSVAFEEFSERLLMAERPYLAKNVGWDEATGLTHDGFSVDYDTGELLGTPRKWSAASKESNHLLLLCLSLAENSKAQRLVTENTALEILEKKIHTYEKFNREYPGFAGFLPWFLITEGGIVPTPDWENRVPGLDNGEWIWSLFLAF